MTQQVSYATAEQKRGGELVVKAMENISEIARDNLATVEEMSQGHGQPGPAGGEPGEAHLGLPGAVGQRTAGLGPVPSVVLCPFSVSLCLCGYLRVRFLRVSVSPWLLFGWQQ